MIRYVVESGESGVQVLVEYSENAGDSATPQPPAGLNEAGLEWGYRGAGPRRLADALLAHLVSHRFGATFMEEVVSQVSPIENHERVVVFHESAILDWLRKKLEKSS